MTHDSYALTVCRTRFGRTSRPTAPSRPPGSRAGSMRLDALRAVNHAEPLASRNDTRITRWRSCIPPAVILLTLAIAGCGTISPTGEATTSSTPTSLGQPIATVTTSATSHAPTATSTSAAGTTAAQPESIRLPPPPTPKAPRSQAILHVATRFANAYLLYQIGRAALNVKQTIRSTSTPSFARLLLSQPINIPSAERSSVADEPSALTSVTYSGPASLGPGPAVQIVVARYHTIVHSDVAAQLTIELTVAGRGWLVTSLR